MMDDTLDLGDMVPGLVSTPTSEPDREDIGDALTAVVALVEGIPVGIMGVAVARGG